ncbi:predicted protein, partial [Postia placenta Mad-698-R]
LLTSLLVPSALAGSYSLSQSNVGSEFLSNFQWENITDPTNGRVEYVTQSTALAENLTYTSSDTFIMRADYTTTLDASGPGRKSNRIKSNTKYNTHVAVFDIRHMPQGCGTWPALWEADDTVGTSAGEVDILEGVNDRTSEYIRVWFWSRNGTTTPSEVSSGASNINTDSWGTPIAYFPDTNCNLKDLFGNHNIIIDLTFCGSWAGEAFGPAGCPGNCTDYVNSNPSAFENAYWEFAAARVY